MLRFIDTNRKSLAILMSAAVLAAGLTASTQAVAGPKFGPHPMFLNQPGPHFGGGFNHPHFGGYGPRYGYGYGPRYGYGFGGAALAGGLMLGALAATASAAAAAQDCHMEKKPMVDAYGNKYFDQVKVCQ